MAEVSVIERQGVEIPRIGLGTWRLTGSTCREAVETALSLGYRHIDTAQSYGNERDVGAAIEASSVDREDIFLTTKVWGVNARPGKVMKTARASLDRLGVEAVDLLLLHWPNPAVPLAPTLEELAACRQEGLARTIGVSNYTGDRLRRAIETCPEPLFNNQIRMHPYKPRTETRAICGDAAMTVTAYSPLTHGGITAEGQLETIGNRYEKTPAQVALRWVIQHDGVVAIPRSSNPTHLEENLNIFDFQLSEMEMEALSKRSRVRSILGWARGVIG